MTLRCGANSSSESAMTFTWKMNNHRLENVFAKRYESALNEGVAQFSDLQLTDVTMLSSGEYQCIVTNNYGVAYSKPSKLSVMGVYINRVKFSSHFVITTNLRLCLVLSFSDNCESAD